MNFDQNATHIRSVAQNGKTDFDIITIGKRAYGRGTSAQGLQTQWCPLEVTASLDPGAVLESLKQSHATLQRIGDETIGGVATTHYHVVTQDETLDIWVDANDRLRRVIQTGDGSSSTADLYDFGADISAIEAPSTKGCGSPSESKTSSGSSQTYTEMTPPQP